MASGWFRFMGGGWFRFTAWGMVIVGGLEAFHVCSEEDPDKGKSKVVACKITSSEPPCTGKEHLPEKDAPLAGDQGIGLVARMNTHAPTLYFSVGDVIDVGDSTFVTMPKKSGYFRLV